jgi:hypothetical protein
MMHHEKSDHLAAQKLLLRVVHNNSHINNKFPQTTRPKTCVWRNYHRHHAGFSRLRDDDDDLIFTVGEKKVKKRN